MTLVCYGLIISIKGAFMNDPQQPGKYNAFNQTYQADRISEIPVSTSSNTRSKNLAAVDQLVNQNQDLMSRLGIALKRVGILEEELQSFKESQDLLSKQLTTVQDENERLKLSEERLTLMVADLKKDRSETEKQFANIYTECSDAKNQNSDLLNKLSRYKRYQQRIKKNVRPYLNQIKTEIEKLKEECASHTVQKTKLDTKLSEVQKNLKDSIDYIQTQSEEFKIHQNQLIELHEKEKKRLKTENKSLTDLYEKTQEESKQLSSELESLQEKNINLENKTIIIERTLEDMKKNYLEKETELKSDISKLKIEKQKTDMVTTLSEETLQSHTKRLKEKEDECDELKKQLEGQKTLFNETVKKLDKITEKEKATQRLNKELSLSLQKQRADLQEYASHNKELQKNASEKVEALCSVLKSTVEDDTKSSPQYNRIEKLLAEIESGFVNNKSIR